VYKRQLHVLAARRRLDAAALLAWAWLGLTTTVHVHAAWMEEILASRQLLQDPSGWLALSLEVLTVVSYILLLVRILPDRRGSGEAAPTDI
jgi:hypothetical protein